MRLAATLLCSTAIAATCATNAQAAQGWYIGLEAGWSFVNDVDANFAAFTTGNYHTILTTRLNADLDDGWAIIGTVGYGYGNWRFEGELGYRDNDLSTLRTAFYGSPIFTSRLASGDLQEFTIMANVLYDIWLSNQFKLSIGGGIGADNVDFDNGLGLSESDWSFAWQVIAGVSYAVTPRTELFINYRFLQADGADVSGIDPAFPFSCYHHPNQICPGNAFERIETDDFDKSAVTFGIRYDLEPDYIAPPPPPPAPPPPPEPAKPRQFLVFFGFNKSNLTAEAENVVAEAAQAARDTGAASIMIVGHTDTVGSNEFNQRLSERRASAVRSSLVAKGIEDSKISASGRGETELMVQTGDGVKEPQNRRATIDM